MKNMQGACRNGFICFSATCPFWHPNGVCAYFDACQTFECKFRHGKHRTRLCNFGHACNETDCVFLHPMSRISSVSRHESKTTKKLKKKTSEKLVNKNRAMTKKLLNPKIVVNGEKAKKCTDCEEVKLVGEFKKFAWRGFNPAVTKCKACLRVRKKAGLPHTKGELKAALKMRKYYMKISNYEETYGSTTAALEKDKLMKVAEDHATADNGDADDCDFSAGDAHDGNISKDDVHNDSLSGGDEDYKDVEKVKKIGAQELAKNQNLDSSILTMIDEVMVYARKTELQEIKHQG